MTKHIVHISTRSATGCEFCKGVKIGGEDFADSVNHFINQHGYSILHIGSETQLGYVNGVDIPWNATIAVLGK